MLFRSVTARDNRRTKPALARVTRDVHPDNPPGDDDADAKEHQHQQHQPLMRKRKALLTRTRMARAGWSGDERGHGLDLSFALVALPSALAMLESALRSSSAISARLGRGAGCGAIAC